MSRNRPMPSSRQRIFQQEIIFKLIKERVKFVTSLIKQAFTYTAVKDVIVHKVTKSYGYDVESSLRGLE